MTLYDPIYCTVAPLCVKTQFGPACTPLSLIFTVRYTEFLNLLSSLFWFRSFQYTFSSFVGEKLVGAYFPFTMSVKNGSVFLNLCCKNPEPKHGGQKVQEFGVLPSVLKEKCWG